MVGKSLTGWTERAQARFTLVALLFPRSTVIVSEFSTGASQLEGRYFFGTGAFAIPEWRTVGEISSGFSEFT